MIFVSSDSFGSLSLLLTKYSRRIRYYYVLEFERYHDGKVDPPTMSSLSRAELFKARDDIKALRWIRAVTFFVSAQ